MWTAGMLETDRGVFEIFTQGQGDPIINLKEAGNSCKIKSEHELSMAETCKDLEAVREALALEQWSYAGRSLFR